MKIFLASKIRLYEPLFAGCRFCLKNEDFWIFYLYDAVAWKILTIYASNPHFDRIIDFIDRKITIFLPVSKIFRIFARKLRATHKIAHKTRWAQQRKKVSTYYKKGVYWRLFWRLWKLRNFLINIKSGQGNNRCLCWVYKHPFMGVLYTFQRRLWLLVSV